MQVLPWLSGCGLPINFRNSGHRPKTLTFFLQWSSWGFLSLRPEAKAHWCGFVEDTGFAWRGICKATWLHQNNEEIRDPECWSIFLWLFRQILDILATWHPKLGNKEYGHKCLVTPTSFGEIFSSNLIFLIPNIEGDDGYAISNDTFGFLIQKLQGEQPPWDWTALETASENAKTRHISRSKSWEHIKVLSRLSILIWNGSLSLALFWSTCHSNKLRMVLVRNSSQPQQTFRRRLRVDAFSKKKWSNKPWRRGIYL